jgi:16S rRNA (cytosine967-C5)-methyltransferase
MQNNGRLVATDLTKDRLKRLHENCARLGVTCAEIHALEGEGSAPSATQPAPTRSNTKEPLFDRILVDAPCSNTGVMRRRVDLRWRVRPEEIERLRTAQNKLMRDAAPRLKPGGTLVYSTCSLEPEENRDVVAQFLREHPAFRLEHERELLPFKDGVDGAFVARFTR